MTHGSKTEAACLKAAFAPVTMPVDITDKAAFPEIAEARRHLASLSPERRAELNREWLL